MQEFQLFIGIMDHQTLSSGNRNTLFLKGYYMGLSFNSFFLQGMKKVGEKEITDTLKEQMKQI
jgi:hypothetical protein